jgi:hypothetical protein
MISSGYLPLKRAKGHAFREGQFNNRCFDLTNERRANLGYNALIIGALRNMYVADGSLD